MREESFIWLPGIRERTERKLWEQGIRTWDHLLDARSVKGVGASRLRFWQQRVRMVRDEIDGPRKLAVMRRLFGTRWAWRLAQEVLSEPRFIDIETTEYANEITVLGVSDGEYYEGFVRGRNLDRQSLERAFRGCTCIVTFNGSSFDLPIIERNFPGLLPDVPHLDLRHICAQAGITGGLKRIEENLGIRRASMIRDHDGADAILLWYRHMSGDREALRELVDYNAADCLNLQPLLELVVPALWAYVRHDRPIVIEALQRT